MRTSQEVFDVVAKHLLTQNAKSMDDPWDEMCAYRGENGRRCAVGALIPDDLYSFMGFI